MTTHSPRLPVEIVDQPDQLGTVVSELTCSRILALDTESNSRHRYPEQLCLIQIASAQKVYVIDTMAIRDITPLGDILADVAIEKVIHSADYDVRCLDRHAGLHIRGVFDTSIAARFVGANRLALDAVIEDMLGTTIEKSKALQQSDWGLRPLSARALDYAATDVRHLVALRERLEQRLQVLGRVSWVAEECLRIQEVRYTKPDIEAAFLSIKGARDLNPRQLAVLRSLSLFREEEAIRQHRPPFFVIPESTLVLLATNPEADLNQVPGLGQIGLKRFGQGLKQALRDGIAAPPVKRPPAVKFVHPTAEQVKRLVMLKEWRTSLGASLSLDPSLLWPMASLERLAREPETLSAELTHESIRNWQREVVASALTTYLESIV